MKRAVGIPVLTACLTIGVLCFVRSRRSPHALFRVVPCGDGSTSCPPVPPRKRSSCWSPAAAGDRKCFVSLLLPVYLLELGPGPFEAGIIAMSTLAGSALLILLVGLYAHRASGRSLLIGAAFLMTLTGIAFATVEDFWPLLLVAFVGTLNPSSGDVSVTRMEA
jgi:hypothetical protein